MAWLHQSRPRFRLDQLVAGLSRGTRTVELSTMQMALTVQLPDGHPVLTLLSHFSQPGAAASTLSVLDGWLCSVRYQAKKLSSKQASVERADGRARSRITLGSDEAIEIRKTIFRKGLAIPSSALHAISRDTIVHNCQSSIALHDERTYRRQLLASYRIP